MRKTLTIPKTGDRVWVMCGRRKANAIVLDSVTVPTHTLTQDQERYRDVIGFFAVRFDSGKQAAFMHAKTYGKKWGFIDA